MATQKNAQVNGPGNNKAFLNNQLNYNTLDSKVDFFLSRLSGVKSTSKGKWLARCPAHEDRSPSLAIKLIHEEMILIHCFAGCSVSEVLSSVGLTFDDVFPDRIKPNYNGIDGYDRYKAKKETPRFSRYELFPKLVLEARILHTAMQDMRNGLILTPADWYRCHTAMETISNLNSEVF
jgi:hypothetical protein